MSREALKYLSHGASMGSSRKVNTNITYYYRQRIPAFAHEGDYLYKGVCLRDSLGWMLHVHADVIGVDECI